MEYCAYCGEPLNGLQRFCPHCGSANPSYTGDTQSSGYEGGYAVPQPQTPLRGTNGLAIAGFACAFSVPLVGLILSVIAGKRAASGEYQNPLPGFAKWGKIISIVSMVLIALFISLYVVLIVYAVRNSGNIDFDEFEDLFDSIRYYY